MKKPSKKTQFEPIHIITILLCLLIAIVFFLLKRKLSTLNQQERNPQENTFLLEAEERRRRMREAEDERRRKEEEEQKQKEEKEKKEDEEIKASKKNSLNSQINSINLNSINNLNNNNTGEKNLNKIPLIDYDKYRKMDSNFFNKNASKFEPSILNKKNRLNDERERYDIISLKNNSLDQSLNNYSNFEDNNSNLGNNVNDNIVMKKIVLLKPEVKLTKEERSNYSYGNNSRKSGSKNEGRSFIVNNNNNNNNLETKSKSSLNEMKNNNKKTPIEKIAEREFNKQLNDNNNNANNTENNNNNNIEEKVNNNNNNPSEKNEGLKGIHLNQEEKDSFLGILGFLNNKKIKENNNDNNDPKIISVEKFFEIKEKSVNKLEKDDENFNKNFLGNLLKTSNDKEFKIIIQEFSEILEKGIIVSRKNYAELFILSIRYLEFSHAIFFLCEMERKKFKIPRILVQELFRQKFIIKFFQNFVLNNSKAKDSMKNNIDNYMILPEGNEYLKNEEFLNFEKKRNLFMDENVENLLKKIDINVEKLKSLEEKKLNEIDKLINSGKLDNLDLNKNNFFGLFLTKIMINTNKNAIGLGNVNINLNNTEKISIKEDNNFQSNLKDKSNNNNNQTSSNNSHMHMQENYKFNSYNNNIGKNNQNNNNNNQHNNQYNNQNYQNYQKQNKKNFNNQSSNDYYYNNNTSKNNYQNQRNYYNNNHNNHNDQYYSNNQYNDYNNYPENRNNNKNYNNNYKNFNQNNNMTKLKNMNIKNINEYHPKN